MRFRQAVCLCGLHLRQIKSPHHRFKHRVARRAEFLRGRAQEHGSIVCGVSVERLANTIKRRCPRVLNRRTDVPAPEAGHVLESPDDLIRAHGTKQENIQARAAAPTSLSLRMNPFDAERRLSGSRRSCSSQ